MTHFKKKIIPSLMLGMAAPLVAVNTSAQILEEVVVTAQKRDQSIQEIPMSIVALNDRLLSDAGVESADELTRIVPNVRISRLSQASATVIRVRGVGQAGNNAIDPSVAPFLDGVYVARGGAILNTFLDVAAVEVLRGPQGTLFGRNATSGAIQVNTNAPQFDEMSGHLFAEVGNYSAKRYRGVLNVPVSDTFAMRVAAVSDTHDGYYDNLLDGKSYGERDAMSARVSLRWQPTDSVNWVLRYDYSTMEGDGQLPAEVSSHTAPANFNAIISNAFGPLSPDISDPFDGTVSQRMVGYLDDEQTGISSDLTWDLDNDYRIRWIFGQREWDNEQVDGDVIFTGVDLVNRFGLYTSDMTSNEVQLISPEGAIFGGKGDFVAGVYTFDEDYYVGEDLNLGVAFCPVLVGGQAPQFIAPCQASPQLDATELFFDQTAESVAAFIDSNINLSDTLKLTVGARYTKDDKKSTFTQLLNNPFAGALRGPEAGNYDFDDSQFTYRVVLSYYSSDDTMWFANYSTGYKSGGINSQGSAAALGQKRIFDSEEVNDIELGVKSTLMDGRMQLNATLYRMELDDFQDRSFRDASFIITNAGTLLQQGLEVETKTLLNDNWSLDFSMAYLDSEFTDFKGASPLAGCAVLPVPGTVSCPNPQDNTGKRSTFSPEWQFNGAISYEQPLGSSMNLNARLGWQYVDEHFAGGSELSSQTITEAYDLWDARVTLANDVQGWTVSLFGENLTDERYAVGYFTQVLGGALGLVNPANGDTLYRHYVSAPRTYGLSVKYEF